MSVAVPSSFYGRASADLRRRIAVIAVLIAGTLAYLPALRSPFLLDDYLQVAMVRGTFPSPRSPFDLYDFVNDADRSVLFARGLIPWWSHPQLKLRFFRPLSSALLWADHRVFGNRPALLHLQSLGWWIFAVLAARSLYKKAFSSRVALFATAIFALAPCHAIPLAWLANREVLVSITLGALAVGAYVRWRDARRARDAATATVLFALAMLGGEYALSFGGYVLAIEIVARREPALRRAVGLLPFAAPAFVYLLLRAALGYGSAGSGFYSDPLRDPRAFLSTAPRRLVTLLADGWLSLDADAWSTTTPWWALALLTAIAVGVLAVPLRRSIAHLAEGPRRDARWMLLGSIFALAPVLAVVPSIRLLGVGVLGIAPIIALLLDRAWFPAVIETRRGKAELTGLVATLLGFAHLVHGPVTSWLTARQFRQNAVDFVAHTAWLRTRIAKDASAEVVVVRGMVGMFFEPYALDPGGAPPSGWRILAHTGHALVLRRDARTLEIVVPRDQGLYPEGQANLFRSESAALRAGDVVVASGMRATIVEAGEHGPYDVRFVFDRDLDTPSLTWIAERFEGFADASPPRVGFGTPLDP